MLGLGTPPEGIKKNRALLIRLNLRCGKSFNRPYNSGGIHKEMPQLSKRISDTRYYRKPRRIIPWNSRTCWYRLQQNCLQGVESY